MSKKEPATGGWVVPPVINGVRIVATIAEGWNTRFLGEDRMIMTHPEHEPVIVAMQSIKEGDVLPRETDERISVAPQLGGR